MCSCMRHHSVSLHLRHHSSTHVRHWLRHDSVSRRVRHHSSPHVRLRHSSSPCLRHHSGSLLLLPHARQTAPGTDHQRRGLARLCTSLASPSHSSQGSWVRIQRRSRSYATSRLRCWACLHAAHNRSGQNRPSQALVFCSRPAQLCILCGCGMYVHNNL